MGSYCDCPKWRGILVVGGGMLVHLSLGTLYTFGNLSPYLTGFMRKHGSAPELTYTECAWIFALALMSQGTSMAAGSPIERLVGPKFTVLLGAWCMSAGVLLTYFSAKHSFELTVVTYGAIFGFGVGIAYVVPLGCAMRWFPKWKGLVNGLVVGGFGGGAFIFNQVQTVFINPDNLKPDYEENGDKYFTQDSVLDKVPSIFLLTGGCYAGMQLIGSLLICYPPHTEDAVEMASRKKSDTEDSTMKEKQEKPAILYHDTENSQLSQVEKPSKNPQSIDEDDVHPLEVIKSKHFYFLWFMFVLNGQGNTLVSTLYKAYGQTFILDDTFMAIVGSFAAVFNACGRVMWGVIADKFSFRVSTLIMCTACTCLLLTFKLSEYGGKPVFFVYVCLMFGSFCGSFALFPTATAKCFGRKYLPVNYALVFSSQIITTPLGVFMSQKLKSSLGWNGLFMLVAGFSFTSLLLTKFFSAKDKNGKEI